MTSTLQFNQPIISTAKNPISTKVLVRRLGELSLELSQIDQDELEVPENSLPALRNIAKELANRKLIRNTDYGVRSLVGLCLAEILRIFAPDAPYNGTQLTEIFRLFFGIFGNLNNELQLYYTENLQLLKRIAEVRSFILITDLPKSEQIVDELFDMCYNQLGSVSSNLAEIIGGLLSDIIGESSSISQQTLKLVLNKFLSLKGAVQSPGFSYSLAIYKSNVERMSVLIVQLFSEILGEEDEEAVFLKNLKKIHRLIIEIWRYVPGMLSTVMGMIDSELNSSDNEKIRIMATETIGQLIRIQPSQFLNSHRDTWNSWTKKMLDKSYAVRVAWVEAACEVVVSRFELVEPISTGLLKSLVDTDERVRMAGVTCISRNLQPVLLDPKFSNNLEILKALGQLAREKNKEVRDSAIVFLGELYDSKAEQLIQESGTRLTIGEPTIGESQELENYLATLIGWIPDHLVNLIYINNKSINYLLDKCLVEQIFGLSCNTEERVGRLIYVVSHLRPKSQAAFWAINKRQVEYSRGFSIFLELIEQDPQDQAKIDKSIAWLAATLPGELETETHLGSFGATKNQRLINLFRLCLNDASDFSTIVASFKEVFNKLKDSESCETFKIILYRSAVLYYNKSNISLILQQSNLLTEQISICLPGEFKSCVDELISRKDLKKISYHFFKSNPSYLPKGDYVGSLRGSLYDDLNQCVYGIKILCLYKDQHLLSEILQGILPLDFASDKLTNHLIILNQIVQSDNQLVQNQQELTSLLIKKVLLAVPENIEVPQTLTQSDEDHFITDSELDSGNYNSCYNKLICLRIFTQRLLNANSDNHELGNLILKLLVSCIVNGGELNESIPKIEQTRLRLEAGLMILKITQGDYKLKVSTVNKLTYLIQDEVLENRQLFIKDLQHTLNQADLSNKLLPLVFFVAYEPNAVLHESISTWIKSSYKTHVEQFELSFVRLLYMICQQQEFLQEVSDNAFKAYNLVSKYILFYLDNVATKENISLLFYYGTRIKQYRDASISDLDYDLKPDYVFNMYRVSDLASVIIKLYCEKKNWLLETFPGKLQLPKDLFGPMKSSQEAQEVAGRVFLDEEFLGQLDVVLRKEIGLKRSKQEKGARKKFKRNEQDQEETDERSVKSVRRSGRLRESINYQESNEDVISADEW